MSAAPSEYLAAVAIFAIRNRGESPIPQDRSSLNSLINVHYGNPLDKFETELLLAKLKEWTCVSTISDTYAGEVLAFSDFAGSIDGVRQRSKVVDDSYKIGHQWLASVLSSPDFRRDLENEFSENFRDIPPEMAGDNDPYIPASDRIVTLNHNQRDEVEDPLDQVLSLLESENSIDGEEGLRELTLGRLRAGKELVKAGIFTIKSLQLTLVVGLRMLVESYGDHMIGAVAGKLLDLLLKQFGIG